MDKKEIREIVKNKKAELSLTEIQNYSKSLSDKFFETTQYKESSVIYVYLSYNQEIETKYIIQRAWADGKTVAAPKVISDGVMEFYEITSFDDIELGYKNIPEPKGDTTAVYFTDVLVLMPGLAFDKTGNRIGYGGGFYDRYLERYEAKGTKFTKVALAYDFQIFDSIPVEDFDKKVDLILV